MLYTLAHAREFVSKFVEAGACPSLPVVVDRINEACRRLMTAANWSGTVNRLRIVSKLNTITLPRGAVKILNVTIDTAPRQVFNQAYEFLDNGPGEQGVEGGYGPDLVDLGDGWPTFFDLPCGDHVTHSLVALSSCPEDALATLTVMGDDGYGAELTTNGLPGVLVPINRWQNGTEGTINANTLQLSASKFKRITAVHKPVTKGYVSLYTYDPADHRMYFVSKYHPDETVPGYRRYRLNSPNFTESRNVLCLVKMRFEPLSHDTDLLPVQNLDAVKHEVMAIREENTGNATTAEAFHNKAIRLLNEQLEDAGDSDASGIQMHSTFSIGGSPNIV